MSLRYKHNIMLFTGVFGQFIVKSTGMVQFLLF